jgi:hypothetical protein
MATIVPLTVRRKSRYFLVAASIALTVVIIGFWTTFFIPYAQGTFEAPPVIYIHGGFLFLWTLLLVLQSTLVQTKKVRLHMTVGWFALVVALGVVVSTMATGVYVLRRDVSAGLGQIAISSLVGPFITSTIFAILVAFAVKYRRRPEIHKRLMLLAMMAIIWPAFFRFRHYFPAVPSPDVYFGLVLPDMMVVFTMAWDKARFGRVHPVYLIAGTSLIAENIAEVMLFDSPPWQTVANSLSGFFL